MRPQANNQRGAALIIVLMIVATLAFVVLALANTTTATVQRAAAARDHSQLMWNATVAEAAAAKALELFKAEAQSLNGDFAASPLFTTVYDYPLDNGSASIRFADATRCLNVNSLATAGAQRGAGGLSGGGQSGGGLADGGQTDDGGVSPGGTGSGAEDAFVALAVSLGIGEGEAARIRASIKDWIDPDSFQEIGGAEDGFYSALPIPYRTGGGNMADVSELRAVSGVTAEIYRALRPYLCALPDQSSVPVNVNLLTPAYAPVLVALTDGEISLTEARSVIQATPPGGWEALSAFWGHSALAGLNVDAQLQQTRTSLMSRYIEADIALRVNEIAMNVRLVFELSSSGDEAEIITRELKAPA